MKNANNWRRIPQNACGCGCGELVAKSFKKGHGRRRPILQRLLDRVVEVDGCWNWTGAIGLSGYGRIGVDGSRTGQVHRVAYAELIAPIPAGLHIDHLCRNRRCVNPAHLEAVTQEENNRRERLTAAQHRSLMSGLRSPSSGSTDFRDVVALLTGERP